jgi:hypothetical protein
MPEVPGGAAVDVVVALAFLLFVLSVVCAAVVELIANARNWRGRMLRGAVEQLHGADGAGAIYATRGVAVLHGPRGRLPSYLPARVYEVAAAEAGQAPDARLFDDLMDRVTGWYKRRVQWALLATALIGCIALNVNVFELSNRFLKDEAIKQVAVEQAKKSPAPSPAAAAERLDAVDQLDIPFGWGAPNRPDGLMGWLGAAVGWLLAAISIPIGASFWFDALSKVSRQRATGNREGTPTDEDHEPTDRDAPGGMDSPASVPS